MAKQPYVHLSDGAGDLCPYTLDLIIEPLQGEGLQRRVRLGEEAHQASGRRQSHHIALANLQIQCLGVCFDDARPMSKGRRRWP